jgi:hypothetical protein
VDSGQLGARWGLESGVWSGIQVQQLGYLYARTFDIVEWEVGGRFVLFIVFIDIGICCLVI